MPSRLSLAALAAALVASPAAAQQDAFEWSGSVPAGATVRVYSNSGDVIVSRAAGSTARVRGQARHGSRGSAREVRWRMVRDGQNVTFCALFTEGGECTMQGIRDDSYRGNNSTRADYRVELPSGVLLAAGSGNGDVTVDGATASVRASSGNGDVKVGSGAGEVHASTGNGGVRVSGARGAVQASSGNGSIDVATARGPVSASSGNGSIRVSMESMASTGDLRFSSGNGRITLLLPDDFDAELDASTGSGSIDSDFEVRTSGRISRHRLRGTIGSGGRMLRVSSGSGSIELLRQSGRR
jgi:hypothetical protein